MDLSTVISSLSRVPTHRNGAKAMAQIVACVDQYLDNKRRAQILEFLLLLAITNGQGGGGVTNGYSLFNLDLRGDMSNNGGRLPSMAMAAATTSSTPGVDSGGDLESIFSENELRSTRSTTIMPFKSGGSLLAMTTANMTTSGDLSEKEGGLMASNILYDQLIQDVICTCTEIEEKFSKKRVATGEFRLNDSKDRMLCIGDVGMVLQLADVTPTTFTAKFITFA